MRLRYSFSWPATKTAPIRKDRTYHSRRPHRLRLKSDPRRLTCERSAANTPIWQVTLDISRMKVLAEAYGMSKWASGHGPPSPLVTDRIVKYIANSAAKNMSSDDSHTIVPTLTRLGRLAWDRGAVSVAVAVATGSIIAAPLGASCRTPLWRRFRSSRGTSGHAGAGGPTRGVISR